MAGRVAGLESELAATRRRLVDLVDKAPHAVVVHRGGVVRYVNQATAELMGVAGPAELVGSQLAGHVHPLSRQEVASRVRAVLGGSGRIGVFEARLVRADGSVVVVESAAARTVWEGAPAVQVVLWDVTRRHQLEDTLAWRASHDALTGLANRTLLVERLDELAGGGRPLSVLYVDLDGFKAVNDRLGHDAGDELLRNVASRLVAAVHADDVVARVGGDEFVVVLVGLSGARPARRVGTRLQALLGEPFTVAGGTVRIGASIGVASAAAAAAAAPDVLLQLADRDMFAAKERRLGGARSR